MQYVNLIHITYMSKLVYTFALSTLLLFKIDDAHVLQDDEKRRDIIINVLKNETQLWRVAFNPTIVKCIFAINRAMMGWISQDKRHHISGRLLYDNINL